MLSEQKIKEQLFKPLKEGKFNALALQIFKYQYQHNTVYQRYLDVLKIDINAITHYTKIPFLPIHFFKSNAISCKEIEPTTTCFTSSGTTGQITSKHYVADLNLYESSFIKSFELFYGSPTDYCILALLPSYLERKGSSLVYMFERLIKDSKHPLSGFYLHNYHDLIETIEQLKLSKKKTLLLGVTYALLDLADLGVTLNDDFVVMETGGMKGKRKEMIKKELHTTLKQKLHINSVHSEYGMTELLSQAYSKKNGVFECPPWMKVLIRETTDPFNYLPNGRSGGINVIDLANLHSCSFIETKDLGKQHSDTIFEIIGRFDNSDTRGCNLMLD